MASGSTVITVGAESVAIGCAIPVGCGPAVGAVTAGWPVQAESNSSRAVNIPIKQLYRFCAFSRIKQILRHCYVAIILIGNGKHVFQTMARFKG
jgi:hypothetical protein